MTESVSRLYVIHFLYYQCDKSWNVLCILRRVTFLLLEKWMNRFIIADASKCIGCRTCEVACVVSHQEIRTAPR